MERLAFLNWSILLLEEIERSPEKLAWCQAYSVYSRSSGQEQLNHDLDLFIDRVYDLNLLIPNYRQILEKNSLDEHLVENAKGNWLAELSEESVLACITWHIRRDHFQAGSLIRYSIGQGAILRLLRHLKALEMQTNKH